jgi:hypothetical protein
LPQVLTTSLNIGQRAPEAVEGWMEYDYDRNIHWYDLAPCEFIQGLVTHSGEEQRAYVVTTVPLFAPGKHPRLPHIVRVRGCA